ncbi:hypothetical protein Anas_14095 [Armadillidium nasatum]|uniref:Uncharacterized protein n=1 Tax=Armadillidium nasatum TaxID=96803 RepID=A0A5N5TFX3_9CRUS|nr:hypothetical protein Anas_14095 [Armadillidium nasatum]
MVMHTNVLFEADLTGLICSNNLEIILNDSGIFRRNSRETSSSNRSSSPLRRHCSSPSDMYHSPKSSPESSRNPSPTPSPLPQRYSTGSTLTPPVSPYHFRKSPVTSNASPKLQETVFPDSPTRSRRSLGNCFGQSTPPGSPSRSFGYYTGPPTKSPSPSPSSGSLKNNNFSSSGSPSPQARSFMQGKIIHCPSTPPSSPAKKSQKQK